MQEPQQHRFESQALQANLATAPARSRQNLPVEPYPHVAQDQCQGNEEKPHLGVACTGLDACLVQLPITRLDAETLPIGVGHPACRTRLDSPIRINPSVTSMLLPRSA